MSSIEGGGLEGGVGGEQVGRGGKGILIYNVVLIMFITRPLHRLLLTPRVVHLPCPFSRHSIMWTHSFCAPHSLPLTLSVPLTLSLPLAPLTLCASLFCACPCMLCQGCRPACSRRRSGRASAKSSGPHHIGEQGPTRVGEQGPTSVG